MKPKKDMTCMATRQTPVVLGKEETIMRGEKKGALNRLDRCIMET
jgi:hypothetical protein